MSAAAGNSESSEAVCSDLQVTIRIRECSAGREPRISKVLEFPNMLKLDNELFTFDHIKWEYESQEKVYKVAAYPFVEKALHGFSTTILTFGSTGSGKSYTMGTLSSTQTTIQTHSDGFIQRCLKQIFEEKKIQVSASFIEICDQELHDLLNMGTTVDTKPGSVKKLKKIKSLGEGLRIINKALALRNERLTSSHSLQNASTLLSHALLTFHLKIEHRNRHRESQLNLIDLAGSRIVAQTGSGYEDLKSPFDENLSALKKAIAPKSRKADLKLCSNKYGLLTSILKDLLNIKCQRVSLVGCISSDPASNCAETLKTLQFAQYIKDLEIPGHTKATSGNVHDKLTPISKILTPVLLPESIDIKQEIDDEEDVQSTEKSTVNNAIGNRSPVIENIDLPVTCVNEKDFQECCKENIAPSKSDDGIDRENVKCPLAASIEARSAETASTLSISRLPTPNNEYNSSSKYVGPSTSQFNFHNEFCLADNFSISPFDGLLTPLNPNDMLSIKLEELDVLNTIPISTEDPVDKSTCQAVDEKQFTLVKDVSQLSISAKNGTLKHGHHQSIEQARHESHLAACGKGWFSQQAKPTEVQRMTAILTTDFSLPGSSRTGDNEAYLKPESLASKEQSPNESEQLYHAKDNKLKRMNAILTTNFHSSVSSQAENSHSANKIMKLDKGIPVVRLERVSYTNLESERSGMEKEQLDDVENQENYLSIKQATHNSNMLRILNTYDAQELTALPQVGFKTAVQIYQYRLIHGNFSSLKDLGNLPAWTDKHCNRFFAANNIVLE